MNGKRIYYSGKFKKKVISEIKQGQLSAYKASQKYKIGGKMTIYNWQKK